VSRFLSDQAMRIFISMDVKYFPDKKSVDRAMKDDDPLLVLVAFNGDEIIVSNADDSVEHYILLKQVGHSELEIDQYFRVVINRSGADWTFVCPASYANIKDRYRRIEKYYNDGIDKISQALKVLGYDVPVNIPDRYRRHFNELRDSGK
jgi:hypothetical protein